MAGKKTDMGPTGETVAGNITRIRQAQGLNYTDVSKRVAAAGREISPLAVRRIEEKQRRLDVDDLMAVSVALGVAPISLMNVDLEDPDEPVRATGIEAALTAKALYRWLQGESELNAKQTSESWITYMIRAAPGWRRAQVAEGLRDLSAINEGGEAYEEVKRKYGQADHGDD